MRRFQRRYRFVGGILDGRRLPLPWGQQLVFAHIPPDGGYEEYQRVGRRFETRGRHRTLPWDAPIVREEES